MFSDQADRPVADRQHFDILFNGDGFDPEITPTGSVKRFFEIQSAGKMHVNAQVEDWIVSADNTEEHYGFGRNGLTWMIASIADRTLDRMDVRGTDWSQFDRDQVSLVDGLQSS
jgi:M6 family metalloprotease-like protein